MLFVSKMNNEWSWQIFLLSCAKFFNFEFRFSFKVKLNEIWVKTDWKLIENSLAALYLRERGCLDTRQMLKIMFRCSVDKTRFFETLSSSRIFIQVRQTSWSYFQTPQKQFVSFTLSLLDQESATLECLQTTRASKIKSNNDKLKRLKEECCLRASQQGISEVGR